MRYPIHCRGLIHAGLVLPALGAARGAIAALAASDAALTAPGISHALAQHRATQISDLRYVLSLGHDPHGAATRWRFAETAPISM